jgi:hypothetical protein
VELSCRRRICSLNRHSARYRAPSRAENYFKRHILTTALAGWKRYISGLALAGARHMKLRFEGQSAAISGGVNFAGYWMDDHGNRRDVLCRVSGEALKILAYDCSSRPAELLAAYKTVSETVHQIAAAQFSAGDLRPLVSSRDIPRGWNRLGDKVRA